MSPALSNVDDGKTKKKKRVILWHRNDLRVHDNLTLKEALTSVSYTHLTLPTILRV